jgi:hypothetical protein
MSNWIFILCCVIVSSIYMHTNRVFSNLFKDSSTDKLNLHIVIYVYYIA